MNTLKIHGGLLVLAVIGALLTWMRDTTSGVDETLTLIWERDTTDVVSVHYSAPEKQVELQQRNDDDGAFLWAIQIDGAERTDTLEYPAGAPGRTLVGRLATLRVIRELGVLSPEMTNRFGLDEASESVEVRFVDERRLLVVGDSAFGGQDRYAIEPATGEGYVIGGDIARPFAIGEGALRERWLHHFVDDDVATVRVQIPGGGTREMARTEAGEWTAVGDDTPDEGFANFMERVDQLAIGGYGAEPAMGTTRPLLRVDYLDDSGETLGFVELLHDGAAERDPYYIRSETTRIMAFAVTSLSERVEQGLGEIF